MKNQKQIPLCSVAHALHAVIMISVLQGCVLQTDSGKGPFRISLAEGDSSVDVFGQMKIAFTKPVRQGDSLFYFIPPFFAFHTFFNQGRDTAILVLEEDLSYGTAYELNGVSDLRSEAGDTLENGISFRTVCGESEPNDTGSLADTVSLYAAFAGQIDPADDKDFFSFRASQGQETLAVALHPAFSEMDMTLYDRTGNQEIGSASTAGKSCDTLVVFAADTLHYLIKISAHPSTRMAGRYRIMILRKG